MIYTYVRISKDTQDCQNQEHAVLKYADQHRLSIDARVNDVVSSRRPLSERALSYEILDKLKKGDVVLVTELSRLGRSTFEVMSILHQMMEKEAKLISINDGVTIGNDIGSKALAFAFSLSAEIERQLISQRTKQALALRKAQGMKLGRPLGSLNRQTKLSGHETEIQNLLAHKVSTAAIARIYNVSRITAANFIRSRGLDTADTKKS